jgi:hypothetical protein
LRIDLGQNSIYVLRGSTWGWSRSM